MILFNIPFISGNEAENISDVLAHKQLANGGIYTNKVKALLKANYGFNDVFLTSSCTSAIELCALSIDLKPGDEVILPSYTFASTPNPFLMRGCRIIFADCSTDYPNLNLKSVQNKITSKTKVIMTMHYGGANNDVEELTNFCKENEILLIEDAAQAIDSTNSQGALGSFGDFSVFSFHDTKNITCGEGGMLVVNNPKYVNNAEYAYQYGTNKLDFVNGKVTNYEWVSLGLSNKLSEISTAFLFAQLSEIKMVTAKRKSIYHAYYEALKQVGSDLITLPSPKFKQINYHNFFLVLKDAPTRKALIEFMKANGVTCTSHYVPLHQSEFAKTQGLIIEPLPNSEFFGSHLLRLPMYFELSISEVKSVTSLIKDFFEKY